MWYPWTYISITLLILLMPLMIPITIKNNKLRKLKNILLMGFIISTFITVTPEKAYHSAPFETFGADKIAYFACSYQVKLTQANFCPQDTENGYVSDCICSNANARATISYCYQLGHPNSINAFLETCQTDFNYTLTRNEFDESLGNYSKFSKSLHDLPDFKSGQVVDFPVKLEESEILLFKDAYDQFLGNYDRSISYGGYLVLYWVIIFTMAGLVNWSKIIFPGLHKRLTDPCTNWFRKNISLPATSGTNKTSDKSFMYGLNMLVPSRLESIILTGFFLLSTYFMVLNIHYVEGDPVFHNKYRALLRYYAVRASILASSMMPTLILFGGRNNFLQWITRWDYATFITLHRWISRIIVVLVIAHSLLYIKYDQDFWALIREPYIIFGIIGTVSGIFILIQGLLILRRYYYESFLLLHIVLGLGFIAGAYLHVADLYCLWFYHYSFAVWMFDRLVRLGRLWSFGFPNAKVYLLADEMLKIVIPKPSHWPVIPGGHVFIHFLQPSCFWQSHPFTYTVSSDNDDEIMIFMKVKQGITMTLYNYLKTHHDKSTSIRVAIEGSYGESSPARRYDTSVFVAGGNGIPGIYAEAYATAMHHHHTLKSRVKLIWIIREYRSLYWFYQELLSLKHTMVETTIYITQPHSLVHLEEFNRRWQDPDNHHDINELTTLKTKVNYGSTVPYSPQAIIDNIKQELPFITIHEYRPSMAHLVRHGIEASLGSVAFVACGHPGMVDELRQAVVDNIANDHHQRIDYFEQLQIWA